MDTPYPKPTPKMPITAYMLHHIHLTPEGLTVPTIMQMAEQDGFTIKRMTAWPILSRLVQDGILIHHADGRYAMKKT